MLAGVAVHTLASMRRETDLVRCLCAVLGVVLLVSDASAACINNPATCEVAIFSDGTTEDECCIATRVCVDANGDGNGNNLKCQRKGMTLDMDAGCPLLV